MRKTLSLIIICFIFNESKAQIKFVNEFLNIGVGARAHGMFGSVVANVADPSAAYWNSSALTELKSPISVSAMHANWFGDVANFNYFTIAKRMSAGKAYGAFSFIRMGIDNIPNTLNIVNSDGTIDFDQVTQFSAYDMAFMLSYAKKLGTADKLSLGGSLKVIRRKIGDFGGAWGLGGDFSLTYKISNRLRLGINARDITTTLNAWSFTLDDEQKDVFLKTGNDVPISSVETALPRLILGVSYLSSFGSKLSLLSEIDLNASTNGTQSGIASGKSFNLDPSAGLELGYANRVFIRAGIGNLQRIINEVNATNKVFDFQPNVGLGISLGRLKIDYALANVGNISGALASHIFSLNLDLAERKSPDQIEVKE
ncbi:MAG: hypothetical protein RLZZ546_55 [Bacteroidota bacterium]|jgi:hypothetical protein